jgi:hypothetical protein
MTAYLDWINLSQITLMPLDKVANNSIKVKLLLVSLVILLLVIFRRGFEDMDWHSSSMHFVGRALVIEIYVRRIVSGAYMLRFDGVCLHFLTRLEFGRVADNPRQPPANCQYLQRQRTINHKNIYLAALGSSAFTAA